MGVYSRGEGQERRKDRLAKVKRGPGVFRYEGGAVEVIEEPTILRVGIGQPKFGNDGLPVIGKDGEAVHENPGTPVKDMLGRPMLGGPPKRKRVPIDTIRLRGVEFPVGEDVEVDNPSLALKLRGMPHFTEIEPDPEPDSGEEAKPAKRGRRKKASEPDPEPESGEA